MSLFKNIKLFYLATFFIIFLFHPISRDGREVYFGTFSPFFLLLWLVLIVGKENYFNHLKSNLKDFKFFIIFLFFCGVSLFYTKDFNYGFLKLMGFIFYIIPLVLIAKFIFKDFYKVENLYLAKFVILLGIMLFFILLYVYPIEYDTKPFTKTFLIWTHVGLSNYLSFALIINFFILKNIEFDKKNKLILFATLFLLFFGLVMVARRATLYGTIIIFLFSFLIDFINKKLNKKFYLKILGIILISFTILNSFPNYFQSSIKRYSTAQSLDYKTYNNDYSLGPRVRGAEIVKREFLASPIFGIGLGGFNAVTESKLVMRYPHNLFLELAVELGIFGLVLYCIMLYKGFKNLFFKNKDLFVIALFYFWLSMTNGGLPDHKLLYMLLFI